MYLHAQSLRIRNIHPLDGSWPRAKRKTAKQSLYESCTSACDKSVPAGRHHTQCTTQRTIRVYRHVYWQQVMVSAAGAYISWVWRRSAWSCWRLAGAGSRWRWASRAPPAADSWPSSRASSPCPPGKTCSQYSHNFTLTFKCDERFSSCENRTLCVKYINATKFYLRFESNYS